MCLCDYRPIPLVCGLTGRGRSSKDLIFVYIFLYHACNSFPEEEKELLDTINAALQQIEEKKYEKSLLAKGFPGERIHKYGFAFQGKKVLIGKTDIVQKQP